MSSFRFSPAVPPIWLLGTTALFSIVYLTNPARKGETAKSPAIEKVPAPTPQTDPHDPDAVRIALIEFEAKQRTAIENEHVRAMLERKNKWESEQAAARVVEYELSLMRERLIPAGVAEYLATLRRYTNTRQDLKFLDEDEQLARQKPVLESLAYVTTLIHNFYTKDARASRYRELPTPRSQSNAQLILAAVASRDGNGLTPEMVQKNIGTVPVDVMTRSLRRLAENVLPKDTFNVCVGGQCPLPGTSPAATIASLKIASSREKNSPLPSAGKRSRAGAVTIYDGPLYCADKELLANRVLPFREFPSAKSISQGHARGGDCNLRSTGRIAYDNDYDPSGRHDWLEVVTPSGHTRWVKNFYVRPADRQPPRSRAL